MTTVAPAELDDDSIAAISDYLDGTLTAERRDEVARNIAADPLWKQAYDELTATRSLMSGLPKARAPESFASDVTATIHARSAGRFFARRTLGDRVPFGVLAVVTAIGLAVLGYFMWASDTGSLKNHSEAPEHGEKIAPPIVP